jgi:hypothetical protein
MKSLIHDVGFLATVEVMRLFSHLLREEEQKDAFWEVYGCVKKALEEYEMKAERRLSRLEPGRN